MPGFLVTNFSDCSIGRDNRYLCEEAFVDQYSIFRETIRKFLDDKVFLETEKYFLITEGVVLNKSKLMKKWKQNTFADTIEKMIESEGECFFSQFRGSFSGAVYNKIMNTWILYTNHIGDKALFYFYDQCVNQFVIASDIKRMLEILKQKSVGLALDNKAVIDMLTFGFMEGNNTYAEQIKRLQAGQYIRISEDGISVESYHQFNRNAYDLSGLSYKEIIEGVDQHFRDAIKLEFEKDLEYGYKHFVDLSGGLDSRMTMWVGATMGYTPMTHITFCQANYADEMIAKDLADYWKHDLWIRPLNSASFMCEMDEIVRMNGGLSLYCGITAGNQCMRELNLKSYGLEHTGQVGDAILGSFYRKKSDIGQWNISGMYSEKIADEVKQSIKKNYCDNEIYLLYVRGLQGAVCTHMIRQYYTEIASPFLDVDFVEYCMSIPPELRIDHALYIDWIKEKYYDAGKFKWEKIGATIYDSSVRKFAIRLIKRGPDKLRRILRLKQVNKETGMNPIGYWYENNTKIRRFMDSYFSETIMLLTNDELKAKLEKYYQSGTAIEKAQCLTVLASYRFYFLK